MSVKGFPAEVKTFNSKAEAQKWARDIESTMDSGAYQNRSLADDQRLYDVLQRYMVEVTPTKRGAKREAEGIAFMQRHKMAAHSMTKLSPEVITYNPLLQGKRSSIPNDFSDKTIFGLAEITLRAFYL